MVCGGGLIAWYWQVQKIKIWNSGYPKVRVVSVGASHIRSLMRECTSTHSHHHHTAFARCTRVQEPEQGYCTIDPSRNAVQNDDADQQTDGSTSRDMGDQGCVLIENCDSNDAHRQFEIKLFEDPNGASDNQVDYPIRLVLSSYWWQGNSYGVPDGKSDCTECTTNCDGCQTTEAWTAFNASSCGYDDQYTRPHRDVDIINAMRGWMNLDNVTMDDLGVSGC